MTSSEERPKPEVFLEALKEEEQQKNKGKLKIFLGMAAGVGKTYTMLEEAQSLAKENVRLIVGAVETHGREETATLLKGLTIIPKKKIAYKDHEFEEMDLDAILQYQPDLVIVDELAHSNIPGARHAKRWQDVLEILDNGIDVYTTLNVQHIESLNDLIVEITDISVRETVPDLVIEKASSIQLVDITPAELIERLNEGKVYLGEQSRVAALHFFQKDRLTALREIVLRYAAEKVDHELHGLARESDRIIDWKPRDKLLVAISPSPSSQKLIRATRRIASSKSAPWIALYVDTGSELDPADKTQLDLNLHMARDLGADVVTLNDTDVVEGIEKIARQRGVTRLIIGRTPTSSFSRAFGRSTIPDRLLERLKDIDILVTRQEKFSLKPRRRIFWPFSKQWTEYLYVTGFIAFFGFPFAFLLNTPYFSLTLFIFFLCLLLLSFWFSKGPIIMASTTSLLAFLVPSSPLFILSHNQRLLATVYALMTVLGGAFIDRTREQKKLLQKNEESIRSLYNIVKYIAAASSLDEMLRSVKERLGKLLDGQIDFLIKTADKGLPQDELLRSFPEEKERTAAIWVFENGKEAGWSTDTLPASKNLYIPLKDSHEIVGLLSFHPYRARPLSMEEDNILHTVGQLVTGYLQRSFHEEKTSLQMQNQKIEKIHKSIIERMSYEFARPILTTLTAIKAFKNKLSFIQSQSEGSELQNLEGVFEGFSKILSNLTAMAQLSEGMVPLRKGRHSIHEILQDCVENALKTQDNHEFQIMIEPNLPLIDCDIYLMELLFYNLLLNALEHSPAGSIITLEAKRKDNLVWIAITDEGTGIPKEDIDHIFEKFYHHSHANFPGVGLGLAIAKTITELHQGKISAENLPEKGARFVVTLPLDLL